MAENKRASKKSCISRILALLFIPFLFLLGLILSYFHIFTLKVEMHTLIIVAFIFIVYAFFVKYNASYIVCLMKGNISDMEEDLHVALRNSSLTIMDKTKSTLGIREFMTDYYRGIRSEDFARVAPSVFPMLGILGTFIAIALSMPDFSSKDVSGLDHEISVLLSGIGTAFYASIYGIMLSLIWIYFEKRGTTKAEKQIYNLEELYGVNIWKKSELIMHEHMQSELKDRQIADALRETFNLDFVKELNEQYLKSFTSIVDKTSTNFTTLTNNMNETSASLQATLKEMGGVKEGVSAISLMGKNIEGFNMNAQNLQQHMEHFDTSVEHTFKNIDKELGSAIEKLTSFTGAIAEQNEIILKYIAETKHKEDQDVS